MVTVILAGDICPIEGNRTYFSKGDARSLFNDLLVEFQEADLSVANLECPFIETASPILKTGPVFGVESSCINGIKQAGIDVLGLANNHIMDHGGAGLQNTLGVCAAAGIATVGAGENLQKARQILLTDIRGIRIGILAVAEHEFSIATKNSSGANPLDMVDYVRNVNGYRDQMDYLIVLLHGAPEFHVPTPRIKDTCHFMIEMGANAVLVQHPHCVGGCEEYRGGHIVYGQGACIMDEAIYRYQAGFHEGFLVKLSIAKDATSRMEIVPIVQSDPGHGVRRMGKERERQFRQSLAERSEAIKDDAFVQARWLEFCNKRKHAYLSALLGHNRVIKRLNAGGFLTKHLYGDKPLLRAKNMVCCETHREVLETIFNRLMV